MARPTKYTPETVKKIVDALSAGCTRKTAAAYAGIDETTFCRWLRRFAGFASSVTLAEAACEVALVATIRAAAPSDWKAASWWLERRRHQSWGRVDRIEVDIRMAAERVAAATGADPDWLIRRAAEIAVLAAAREQQGDA
jgi:hypothetical protein